MSHPVLDEERLMTRMRRTGGQERGVNRMIDEEVHCIDVLTRVSAVIADLKGAADELDDDHVRPCVVEASPEELDEKLAEAAAAIARLTRS